MAGRLTAVLITPAEGPVEDALGLVGRALQGGVTAVLVRRPRAPAREVYELARQLRPATRSLSCLLLVSDRADVALAVDADGVHLGARSLPLQAARRILRPGMLAGRSVHNLDECGQAEEAGADYVFLGPVFATRSHPGQAPLGVAAYREAVLRSSKPVVAVGGVTPANVERVAQAGGRGCAAIRAFSEAEDPAAVARAFRMAFGP